MPRGAVAGAQAPVVLHSLGAHHTVHLQRLLS